MSNFEKAVRQKLRFPSIRGLLTTEDLWDLPLTSKNGLDLNSVAQAVNAEVKASGEESFVGEPTPASTVAVLKLDVVKAVIAVKIAERDAEVTRKQKREKRDRLLELLANKEDAALAELTPDQIREQLAALDD